MAAIRRLTSPELTPEEIRELRALFTAAWPDPDEAFADEDWQHALGGVHVLLEEDGRILSHASVVPRVLEVGRVPLHTGYVEAVATWPELQRRGHGSAVMRQIGDVIAANYQLGALGTGEFAFYGRLGWERWRGPTSVRTPAGETRTPAEDGYIMVLRTPGTPLDLDLEAPISCEWRSGDVW
jgi:aminoglycoside 2'-N-acetyltransferase I